MMQQLDGDEVYVRRIKAAMSLTGRDGPGGRSLRWRRWTREKWRCYVRHSTTSASSPCPVTPTMTDHLSLSWR
jgi:hypothetical protein